MRAEPHHYDFNSQPHEEADDIDNEGMCGNYISTHSLTKRLTELPSNTSQMTIHFNSQPHEEADGGHRGRLAELEVFQLTASRRG